MSCEQSHFLFLLANTSHRYDIQTKDWDLSIKFEDVDFTIKAMMSVQL